MDPVRTPSSLEATGASENEVQVLMRVSDEELVAPTMAGFGTPEVPLDGSRFEAYRFPAPTCPEYAAAVAPRPEPSASNMTTAELAKAVEVLSLLNQSGRLQRILAHANCTLFFTSRAAFVCKRKTRGFRVFAPENKK